jgi:hypothetical protein
MLIAFCIPESMKVYMLIIDASYIFEDLRDVE